MPTFFFANEARSLIERGRGATQLQGQETGSGREKRERREKKREFFFLYVSLSHSLPAYCLL